MKKGFTLIELLAVILILGIIALIAIPTVNKIISEARYGAFKSSNDNIMKAVEQKCQINLLNQENQNLLYTFKNGKPSSDINVKGELPLDGYILLNNNCIVTDYYLTDNKNVYSNSEDIREDYMLKAPIENNVSIFKSLYNDYYTNISSVNFITNLNIPENAIEIKDPTVSGNEKVKSWLVPNGEYYDLYIGSLKRIYGNYESVALFENLINNQYFDFSNFNTEFIQNMNRMFYDNGKIKTIDLSKFRTNNVRKMAYMFYSCESLRELDLRNFNTEKVISFCDMFGHCYSLSILNIKSFSTSKIQDFTYMFNNCQSLTSIDLSHFDVRNIKSLKSFFYNCINLKEINLSTWGDNDIVNVENMLINCSALEFIDLGDLNISKVSDLSQLFSSIPNIRTIKYNNIEGIKRLIEYFPLKENNNMGKLIVKNKSELLEQEISVLNSKNWNVI